MKMTTLVLMAALAFFGCDSATTQPHEGEQCQANEGAGPDDVSRAQDVAEEQSADDAGPSEDVGQSAEAAVEEPLEGPAARIEEEEPALEPEAEPSLELNLYNAADNLTAFTKTRGSLDPTEEVVYYWTGTIHLAAEANPSGQAVTQFPGPILQFEGFNIARFVPVPGGVRMVSREISLYKDLAGNIIDCWNTAPLGYGSPKNVPVIHVMNDPVNFTISGGSPHFLDEDQVVWTMEVMLQYPNPLPLAQFSAYSASNTYESAEMFNFYSSLEDLNDPTQDSIPVTISWSRMGQLLPWMQGGQLRAKLVYHTHGKKLLGGYDALPAHLKDWVANNAPEYSSAPAVDTSPNITSWRYFRDLVDTGLYVPYCE